MDYERIVWHDNKTALSAQNMNNIESGIEEALASKVTANPTGTYTQDLTTLQIGTTGYNIKGGTSVEANPTGVAGTTDLSVLKVGDTAYKVPVINSTNRISADYIQDGTTNIIPTVTDETNWNSKQAALSTAQLNAVNSGIDSTKVAQIETNKNNITNKQDKLTFDITPTTDSTNPVTSGGIKSYVDGKVDVTKAGNNSFTGTNSFSNATTFSGTASFTQGKVTGLGAYKITSAVVSDDSISLTLDTL